MNRKAATMKTKHDAFKYCKPDAPTESGLYWPEQMNGMWSYCTYLGSIQLGIEKRKRFLDLGVYPAHGRRQETLDGTTCGPEQGDYSSNPVSLCRYVRGGEELFGPYNGVLVSYASHHISVVLHRCLKYGIPVHAWMCGPLVMASNQTKLNQTLPDLIR